MNASEAKSSQLDEIPLLPMFHGLKAGVKVYQGKSRKIADNISPKSNPSQFIRKVQRGIPRLFVKSQVPVVSFHELFTS
jgi:hypothetical protein